MLLCQSDRHWVRQTPQSTVLHTVTHSPREEDQPHPWKEAARSFIMPFFSLYHPNTSTKQIKSLVSSLIVPQHRHKHTHVMHKHRWVAQNFMCCFPFLFVSATLGAVTLIPALQVAAQEAGLRNAGPCACLRSSSLVMRVWLTQLVCLSANWVGLREKKQSDIRGKC